MSAEERQTSPFYPSEREQSTRRRLVEVHSRLPIPREDALDHLELFMRPQRISEIVSLDVLYRKILNVHGIVVEFGVRWGRHLSVFIALRTRYEPHNLHRRIVGFDTFAGFCDPSEEDGASARVRAGAMGVSEGYENYLEEILALHEQETPGSHIRRFALIKGDAPEQLAKYLAEHPETIVAMAYFDMDLYRPTKRCLELLEPHVTKGSILAFDQTSHPDFPGETIALRESRWFGSRTLQRMPHAPYPTFISI